MDHFATTRSMITDMSLLKTRSSVAMTTIPRNRSMIRQCHRNAVLSYRCLGRIIQARMADTDDDDGVVSGEYSRRKAVGQMLVSSFAMIGAFGILSSFCPVTAAGERYTIEDVMPSVNADPVYLLPRERKIADVFDRVNPSVVNIYDASLKGRVPTGNRLEQEGNGTGFVIDNDNHVVTNYHVLQNTLDGPSGLKLGPKAKVAVVYFLGSDGTERMCSGYLVGSDRERDIAVLKIDPSEKIQPIKLGSSASLRIGETVIAIGNPFGFEHTLTTGIVSALDRGFSSQTGSVIGGGIQTDAPLNPGNSGGPLLNLNGEVVGVNCAIFSNTGQNVGIGFSIPIETVQRVVPQLIENGFVKRASLGLTAAPDPVARSLNVSSGVLIQTIDPNGPAAMAGLQATRRGIGGIIAGDVIIELNGKNISNVFNLSSVLDSFNDGETVQLTVLRDGQPLRVTVKLAAQ